MKEGKVMKAVLLVEKEGKATIFFLLESTLSERIWCAGRQIVMNVVQLVENGGKATFFFPFRVDPFRRDLVSRKANRKL